MPQPEHDRDVGAPSVEWISAEAVFQAAQLTDLLRALEAALRAGAGSADPARTRLVAADGTVLLMPSLAADAIGVKLVTVTNRRRENVPRVQGVYVLFDAQSLTPVAVLDAASLTAIRTAAVSALAASHLAPQRSRRLVVFGTGVQARSHIEAMRRVLTLDSIEVVGSTAASAQRFADQLREPGGPLVAPAAADAVELADVVCCCTTSSRPVFQGERVRDDCLVIAIGAHEPHTREIDSQLMARALVVVESRPSALAEAGDVAIPVREGALDPDTLVALADVIDTPPLRRARPTVFKGTGMSWQDLAIAQAIYSAQKGR